ncbi:hypothetical protein KFL_002090030 [Klebsormidium nitens]|uniref:Exonuclease domain-containing protein n=1 Tax=Klebsormidium nitens TaxID=105231 RepID=A0A1Y1I6U1_KLENI|nr:hypothetical protein KFL_002090030 [Klebsormidium nitens]|eukprot:GAQ84851.1 hypothetical protein KFL_002090030 [Klebsormidium nitens]
MSASSRAFFSPQQCSIHLPPPLRTIRGTSYILESTSIKAHTASNRHHRELLIPLIHALMPSSHLPAISNALRVGFPVDISPARNVQQGPLAPSAVKQTVSPWAAHPGGPCRKVTPPPHLLTGLAALSVAVRKRGLRTRAAKGPSPVKLDNADQPKSQPWVADLPGWLEGIRALPLEERPCPMVVVFDIETTSLSRRISRIIEFAARDAEGGEGAAIHSLIFPGPHQSVGGSIHSHHISDAMLTPALPTWGQFFPKLRFWVESRNPDARPVLFVAHNGNSFDVPIVAWESAREGLAMPQDWLYVDTLRLAQKHLNAKQVDPEKGSLRLEHLKRYFQVPSDKAAHRAPADVDVTLHVLSRILQYRCLPVGILYDFVMAFGIADREFRFGLKKDEFAALQDLVAAGEQQKREQDEKALAWPGVFVTNAHRRNDSQGKGDRNSVTRDGPEKEEVVREGRSSGESLLVSALAHVGEEEVAVGKRPADPSNAVAGPQMAGDAELPKPLPNVGKAPVIASVEVRRLRSKIKGSLKERASSEGQADVGGGGGDQGRAAVDGEGQGGGVSGDSKHLPGEAREGPLAPAGVERTLPLLANRQGRVWPRLPLRRVDVTNGAAAAVPVAAAEGITKGRLPASAVVQERDSGGSRARPPFGKAGELMAHLDDLRERVAKRTSDEPSAALQGEDTQLTSAGGTNVLVRGPVVVTTGGDGGNEADRGDTGSGDLPSAGDALRGQLQASARRLKRQGQQNEAGEGLERSRKGSMDGAPDMSGIHAGMSTSQGERSESAAFTQEPPSVMERYRLLMAQSRRQL